MYLTYIGYTAVYITCKGYITLELLKKIFQILKIGPKAYKNQKQQKVLNKDDSAIIHKL